MQQIAAPSSQESMGRAKDVWEEFFSAATNPPPSQNDPEESDCTSIENKDLPL